MKRLLKVTAMTGLLTLLKMAMGFVIAKVVAIYTGPSGLAMLGQVQSMVASLNGIINAPVGVGVVRFTAEHRAEGFSACAPWWRASVQLIFILSAILIPVGLLLAENFAIWLFQDSKLTWIVVASICALPLSAFGTLCNSVINGQQLYRRYVCLGMISTLISSITMISLIITANIKGALFASAIQSSLIGLVMLLTNLRQPWFKLRYWWGHTDNKARKAIGGYMLMAITSALTVPISLIFVRNILVQHVGWDIAGHWQAVWKVSEVYLSVITMALGTYFLPRLASLVGIDAITKEINNTAKLVIPIVILMSFAVYLLRDVAISLLFTEAFRTARDLFAIQLTGDVIKIVSWLYAYPMLSRGATKWFVSTEIIFAVTLVLLTSIFVPNMGVEGACLAYTINYSMCLIFILFNYKRFSK